MAEHDARLSSRNESVSHYHRRTRWMGHWKQASGIAATEYNEHCTHSVGSYKKSYIEQEGYLQIKNIISEKVESVSIDMGEGSTSASRSMSDSIHNDLGLTLQVHGTAELVGSEKGKCAMNNSTVEKDTDTYNVAVSDKLYLHKLQDSSINWENYKTCHFLNAEGLSKDVHFPMYGMNQKIWSNVNPNKGPEFKQMAGRFVQSLLPARKSTMGSHLTEITEEELHCVAESSAKSCEQEIEPFESVEGLHSLQAKFAASTSQPAIDRPKKVQTPKMKSPLVIHNEKSPSTSDNVFDEHPRRTRLTNMTHELCTFTGQSRVTVSGIKDANESADSIRSSWSKMKSGSMQVLENSGPGNLAFPSVVRKKKVEYIQHSSSKSSLEDRAIDLVGTAKANGGALFEMFTVPVTAWSHEKRRGDPPPLISSNNNGNEDNAIENETHMTGIRKRSSKTNTIHIDACKTRSPLGGMVSDRKQKDLKHTDLIKSPSSSASPIKQAASRHAFSLKRNCSASNRELSSSRTESINEDHVLSHVHVQRSNIADSTCIAETSTQGQSYSRWLKRLGHKTPDEFATGTKRTKIINNPPGAEVCSLSSKVNNYSVSTSDTMEYLEQHQIFDRTKKLPKTLDSSYGPSAEKMLHWIKRWCHKMPQSESQPVLDAPIPCEPEETKVLPDNLEKKKFPSIRAMALMGKAMDNFQKGEFRRKGALVLWNTEEF